MAEREGRSDNSSADRDNQLLSALRRKLGRSRFAELLKKISGGETTLDAAYREYIPFEERSPGVEVIRTKRQVHSRHTRTPRDTRGRNPR